MIKKEKSDFISELESTLSPERVKRARKKAAKTIFEIELKQLREELGITQKSNKVLSQSNISKIENRNDMKVSTLITYVESLGAGIEIYIIPEGKSKKSVKLFSSAKSNPVPEKNKVHSKRTQQKSLMKKS